jgi:hypothetical protein
MKQIYTPISIALAILAGFMSRKLFERLWDYARHEEAPKPKQREIDYAKLVPALIVEGAITGLVRGFVEHGARHGYARLTGSWPGEERPKKT